jgi:DNA-binding response OmpR family regulator
MNSSEHSHTVEYSGRVVVVDDNDGLRQMLSLALETAGFKVIEARTLLDLQRHLAHTRPDALVIDLQRAEADGLHLLQRMRARQSLREVPILFLSGSDAEDFRLQAMTAGADWFGLRPLGMIELQNRVAELIRSGRRAAAVTHPPQKQARQVVQLKRTG